MASSSGRAINEAFGGKKLTSGKNKPPLGGRSGYVEALSADWLLGKKSNTCEFREKNFRGRKRGGELPLASEETPAH